MRRNSIGIVALLVAMWMSIPLRLMIVPVGGSPSVGEEPLFIITDFGAHNWHCNPSCKTDRHKRR